MPRRKKKSKDDEIELLSSEFHASTNYPSRVGNKRNKNETPHNNNNKSNTVSSHERALTLSILDDLEAQGSALRMDLEPPRAWRPNPLYDGEGEEVGLEELQPVDNTTDGGNDSNNNNNSDGLEQIPNAAAISSQFLKKRFVDMAVILVGIFFISIVTLRFGFPETFKSLPFTNSGERSDQNSLAGDDDDFPTIPPIESTSLSPSYNPTIWPTYTPTIWPTYTPTISVTYSPSRSATKSPTESPTRSPLISPTASPSSLSIINGTNVDNDESSATDVENVTSTSLNDEPLAPTDEDLFGNNSLSTDDLVLEEFGNLTADATATTVGETSSTLTNDILDVLDTTSTSSTELSVTSSTSATTDATTLTNDILDTTTTDATTTTISEITATEAALTTVLPLSTSTAGVSTAAATSTETTNTEAAATIITTTEVAAITASPYLCSGTTSGKIFKIAITPTASTTSLVLLRQDENSGEYNLVTTYNDDSLSTIGATYVKKVCVLPGKYKFVVRESADACYNGFFKGVVIFDDCGDGEYAFDY